MKLLLRSTALYIKLLLPLIAFCSICTTATSQEFGTRASMMMMEAKQLSINQPHQKITFAAFKDDGYDGATQTGYLRIKNNSGMMAKLSFDLVARLKCGKEKTVHYAPFADKNAAYINITSTIAAHEEDCNLNLKPGTALDIIESLSIRNFQVKFYTDCEWDEYKFGIKCNGNNAQQGGAQSAVQNTSKPSATSEQSEQLRNQMLSQLQQSQQNFNQQFDNAVSGVADAIIQGMIRKSLREESTSRNKKFNELQHEVETKTGELIDCDHCNGKGYTSCKQCSGSGKVTCTLCFGSGKNFSGDVCLGCKGNGKSYCMYCNATGNYFCTYCSGTGKEFKEGEAGGYSGDQNNSNSYQQNNAGGNAGNNVNRFQIPAGVYSLEDLAKMADDRFNQGYEAEKQGNYEDAFAAYEVAAKQGNRNAQNNLGNLYLNIKRNEAKAFEWFKKAADQDNDVAQQNLGYMYETGRGTAKDLQQAKYWYGRAADHGNRTAFNAYESIAQNGSSDDLNSLGEKYQVVKKDYVQAMQWYLKSAKQNNSFAQNNIGRLYEIGLGVTKDYAQAMQWYQKSAAQGNTFGQFNLGLLYYYGYGVAQDYAQALQWWQKGADAGYSASQNDVGFMYENGFGVTKDIQKARYWYEKAAAQGYEFAKTAIRKLDAAETPVFVFATQNGTSYYRNTEGNNWGEFSCPGTNPVFNFTFSSGNDNEKILYDQSRGVYVKITRTECFWGRTANDIKNKIYTGSWVKPAELNTVCK